MDKILEEHPTLESDLTTLYQLAKQTAERREAVKKKREQSSENSGTAPGNVVNIQQAGSIKDAFELAEKKLSGGK